jgi:hypothetical protein
MGGDPVNTGSENRELVAFSTLAQEWLGLRLLCGRGLVCCDGSPINYVCRASAVNTDVFSVKQLTFQYGHQVLPRGPNYGQAVDYQSHSSFRSLYCE